MNKIFIEYILLLLALVAMLSAYFRLHNREGKNCVRDEGVNEWIESQLRGKAEKAGEWSGQSSWLIVYNKYSNSIDSEEAICRAVTWAFCRGRSNGPVGCEIDYREVGNTDLSGMLMICQERHSFLVLGKISNELNS